MENVPLTVQGMTIDAWKYPVAQSHIYVWNGAKALVSLLDDFRKCPAADELLSRVASRRNLILGEKLKPNVISSTFYTDVGPWIMMAPEAPDPLATLAFELFNAEMGEQNTTLAENGMQNIDEYAKQICTEEYVSYKGRKDIAKRCNRDWGKGPDYLKKFGMKDPTLEEFLFEAEWQCAMDAYREDWQRMFKPVFCKVHPKDPECIGPPRKFCDPRPFQFMKKQSVDTKKWMKQRFCDLFSQSSKELQHTLQQKYASSVEDCAQLSQEAKTDL